MNAAGIVQCQRNATLIKQQQTKVAALKKEFGQRRAELQKQLDDLHTNEQKQARDAAKKKALAEGNGGVKLEPQWTRPST